jgi:hypothetical protein
MGKIFVATDTELKPLVSGNVNDGKWEDFTPYSTTGLTDISAMRREEGGCVHYVIHARTSTSITSGDFTQPDIRLYNVASGFIFKSVLVGSGNEGAGRPLAYTRGEPDATSNIGLVITNTSGFTGYFWVTLDVWANS